MANVVQLRPATRQPASRQPLPDPGQSTLELLDNVSVVADILETMSAKAADLPMAQARRGRVLRALFDAVTELEAAAEELAAEIEEE